ncbi:MULTISPECIES: GNAT family N-acetyltransferase [Xenorhabdus]|uniref:GNAT family N-acetyltransferase n=1 Tax=Xenorhabdus TaxID=626 RepID=UPI000649E5DC|nr:MULTISPECIES: GNAT family N-acetyltransferase [Xenorhabdus]KLU15756.1 acetyltransferase [Xenorhabdus griffiniae]KOP35178.1 acetyltransferase [Xenorhabdus sp. GDc328]WFQ80636.1 GNAT family N-acetyltransferase [Xenorhabdus sp. SF857]
MPLFSKTITDFWQALMLGEDILYKDDVFTIITNARLEQNDRVMVLEISDGRVMAVLTPEMAEKAGLYHQEKMSESIFRQKLNQANITLHGADYIFYFPETEKRQLLQENSGKQRQLMEEQDGEIFSAFQALASEQDLDNAYVELDHWSVFGAFDEKNHLVSAASMYPWNGSQLADMGVLTLESFRSQGYARKVVRAISQHACAQGYEPQFRCQLDNLASAALAKAAGLTLFGKWEIISPDSVN